jgi:Protein of unknown function (DUF2800)
MSAHSTHSPSKMDRWSRCPGSINMCASIPEDRTSKAAALGTAKHECSYYCLMHTYPTQTADGMQGQITCADSFAFTIDDEFVDHVNTYLKGVRAAIGKDDSAYFELPLDMSPVYGVAEQSGTGDAVLLRHARRDLYVGDAKFGWGPVSARRNRQLLSYAAAALFQFDEFGAAFDTVTLAIHQPRVADLPSEWTVRAHLVRRWAAAAAKRAARTLPETAPLIPGEIQCQWCPARATCKARANNVLLQFPLAEKAQSFSAETADIAAWLNEVDMIESWCRDIRAEALRRAQAGQDIPGYKIIEGRRGPRRWADEMLARVQLEQDLGENAYKPREIVTPTEAEKRLKKASKPYADVAWLVEQSAGAPSLAKVTEVGTPMPKLEFGLEEAT